LASYSSSTVGFDTLKEGRGEEEGIAREEERKKERGGG